jgi:hypothetical protein
VTTTGAPRPPLIPHHTATRHAMEHTTPATDTDALLAQLDAMEQDA